MLEDDLATEEVARREWDCHHLDRWASGGPTSTTPITAPTDRLPTLACLAAASLVAHHPEGIAAVDWTQLGPEEHDALLARVCATDAPADAPSRMLHDAKMLREALDGVPYVHTLAMYTHKRYP